MHLVTPASSVFPLFEPLGEKRWAEGWEPEMIYPPSGETEEGMLFTILDEHQLPSIWTVVLFDPGRFQIVYLPVTPGSHTARIAVTCTNDSDRTTCADVTYTFTALTEIGNSYIQRFTENYYRMWIGSWETAINHYLRHGTALHHNANG